MPINQLLTEASQKLRTTSPSARLDCEILLTHVLNKPKTFLYTYPDYHLAAAELETFQELLQQRYDGKPIAYIIGKQAFWTFELKITADVLIPRPETESLVEKVLEILAKDKPCKVADLGVGSGAIAIALALERPLWHITATDISSKALALAQANAEHLGVISIQFQCSDWGEMLEENSYDCIVTNPPYIAEDDPELEENVKKFEPKQALISGETGLECIEAIIKTAKMLLKPGGYLLLEHGYRQHAVIKQLLEKYGYINISTYKDFSGHFRISAGQKHFS